MKTILLVLLFHCSFAGTFYVSVNGKDTNDGSFSRPWRTIRTAVVRVPSGSVVNLLVGTFIETSIIVPVGVSIIGTGIGLTTIKTSEYYHPIDPGYSLDKFLIILSSDVQTNGDQTLSNFTINGDQKQLHGGILVRGRNNVLIDGVKVQDTNFTGIWLWDVRYSGVRNVQLLNCSWGSTAYCVGALNVGGIESVDIDHIDINENTGYGIKAIGPSGNNNLINFKIHDSRVSVTPVGLWSGGMAPNIAIELWQTNLIKCEISKTYIDNTVSLVNNLGVASTGIQTIRIHNCTFDLATRALGKGYPIELSIHDAEVDHNTFVKGSYGIANWSDKPYFSWDIHDNTFYAMSGQYPGECVRSQKSGLHSVWFHSNTVTFTGSNTMNVIGLYSGASENVKIESNLLIDANTAYNYYPDQLIHMEGGAILMNATVKDNLLVKLPVGNTPGAYLNNITIK